MDCGFFFCHDSDFYTHDQDRAVKVYNIISLLTFIALSLVLFYGVFGTFLEKVFGWGGPKTDDVDEGHHVVVSTNIEILFYIAITT